MGSADGRVYAFEAATGRRLWSFLAAPANRWITVYGKLMSTWPVAGGVVVDKGESAASFEETGPQLRQEVAREIVMALVEELRENADIQRFGPDGTPLPDPPPEGAAPEAAPPAE